jgi:hypothetical protein
MTNSKKTQATTPRPKSNPKPKAAPATKALPVKAAEPAPAPAPKADTAKPRHKLIRDSFTIPKTEYVLLEALKLRAANLARPTKKSEVLRAGIAALNAMTDKAFIAALDRVPSLKTGRPKAEEKPAGK